MWRSGFVSSMTGEQVSMMKKTEQGGQPSFIVKVEERNRPDRRLTVDLHILCPGESQTILHEKFTERLGYRELCSLDAKNVNGCLPHPTHASTKLLDKFGWGILCNTLFTKLKEEPWRKDL